MGSNGAPHSAVSTIPRVTYVSFLHYLLSLARRGMALAVRVLRNAMRQDPISSITLACNGSSCRFTKMLHTTHRVPYQTTTTSPLYSRNTAQILKTARVAPLPPGTSTTPRVLQPQCTSNANAIYVFSPKLVMQRTRTLLQGVYPLRFSCVAPLSPCRRSF